jgi:hypothetical protein
LGTITEWNIFMYKFILRIFNEYHTNGCTDYNEWLLCHTWLLLKYLASYVCVPYSVCYIRSNTEIFRKRCIDVSSVIHVYIKVDKEQYCCYIIVCVVLIDTKPSREHEVRWVQISVADTLCTYWGSFNIPPL